MKNSLLSDLDDHLQDYNYSRVTLYKILESGMGSIEVLQELATESENPRAFEVYSTFLKNMADISDKLVQLQDKHFTLKEKREKKDPNLIEVESLDSKDRIVFKGETAEVLEVIESRKIGS